MALNFESVIRLALLSSFSRLQLIQNLAPSTIVWRQFDIRIEPSDIFQFLYVEHCNR